ncbi:MAG: alpha/beta fold hydrolase [Promethearchaeota archaeon]
MINLYADVNGIKICYNQIGEGTPIILTHGYGAKKEIWNAQQELAEEFQLITYDIRGVGKSDRPNYPYTMEMLADDVKGLMDFLELEKAIIGGRSLGGMVSQNFALKYPKYVEKLILITTNYGTPDESAINMLRDSSIEEIELLKSNPVAAFWKQARSFYHISFRKQMETDPKKRFHGLFSAESLIRERTIDPPRPEDLFNLAEALKTHNTAERLHKIKCPTLMIAGTHDRLTPLSSMKEMLNLIPNSKLEIIQKAGHFLTLSRAPEVNKIILSFLKE